ncbi:hypothetical protein [Oceaniglobus indicus]|uniref:hypothetical protein n=1 Tax=Oceaniglobus indicus TaxID=2047749 RepID=UPI000C18212A|nr:hypothetical protein [Oceaniglobus indicus]
MRNLHLLKQTFSQARQASGTHQLNGAWPPLTEFRVSDVSQAEMLPWIAALVADLVTNREVSIRTLIDWQHQIAARIRWKIHAIRGDEKTRAHQMALFDDQTKPTWSDSRVVRFDEMIYQDVPTQPTGAFGFKRHLLGAEFQCAWSLDSLDEVDVWVRNVARHPDSFSPPRVGRRFYPDFVARLQEGRIFVVEYKCEHLIGAPEAREKDAIGRIWARTTDIVFLMVRKVAHGAR